jgi:hypothetical protein
VTDDPVGRALVAAVDALAIPRSELAMAAGLASIARRGVPLSLKQSRTAYRILTRSRPDMDVAGIPMPPEPAEPVAAPRAAQASPPPPSAATPVARIRSDGKIGVYSPYALREAMKEIPGGKPIKTGGRWEWVFPASPSSASALVAALSPHGGQFSAKVLGLAADHASRGSASMMLVDGSPLPDVDTTGLIKPGFVLWDHQIRAVEYSTTMVASLLAIPMGGGKTLSTITVMNRVAAQGAKTVVIVCPNKVRGVWPREVRKFSALGWHIVNGTRESKRAHSGYVSLGLADRLHQAEECLFDCRCGAPVHAAVVNYEAFANDPWGDWTPPRPIDLLVMDEIHRIKSYKLKTAKRRRTVSGALAQWVNFTHKRIGLTGTPIPQSPLDIYGIFRALDPGIFGGSWTQFKNRYSIANPHIEQMIVGYKNVEELAEKFFSITYHPEIDLNLPAVTDVTHEFDLEAPARKAYESLDKELWADLSGFTNAEAAADQWDDVYTELNRLMENGEDYSHLEAKLNEPSLSEGREVSTVTPANVMVRLLRLQQLTGGTVIDDEDNRVRVSTAKAELLADVLDEIGCTPSTDTHTTEPVIVFCRFRSDLDAVRDVALAAKLRYAEVSGRRHDGLSRDAEMNPGADVVGVQIQSGGTGVDFTRARIGIWYSLGYSLSDYQQARKRLDRPGQTRPVLMIHLLARETADFDVYEALESRRTVIANVIKAHGIDPAKLGFRDALGEAETDDRRVSGAGAVELPFARLMKSEALRMGAPVGNREERT